MKIKAIHIDDELHAREVFKNILEEFHPDVDLIGQASCALEGVKLIQNFKPDIVFMDVSMPGGSGFDLLDALNPKPARVVFLTAHNNYAIKAIKKGAYDYILKPIDLDELELIMEKIKGEFTQQKSTTPLYIHSLKSIEVVDPEDIIYLQSDNSYTSIFTESAGVITSSKSISFFLNQLSKTQFVRVHQSYAVNFQKIKKIVKEDNGLIILNTDVEIPISRRNKSIVLDLFSNLG